MDFGIKRIGMANANSPKLSAAGRKRVLEILFRHSPIYKAIYEGKFSDIEEIHREISKIIEELAETEGTDFVFDNHIELTKEDFVKEFD